MLDGCFKNHFLFVLPVCRCYYSLDIHSWGGIKLQDGLSNRDDINDAIKSTKPGAQWIIVVCWAAIFVQLVVITLRFLNLQNYIGFFIIAVSMEPVIT